MIDWLGARAIRKTNTIIGDENMEEITVKAIWCMEDKETEKEIKIKTYKGKNDDIILELGKILNNELLLIIKREELI